MIVRISTDGQYRLPDPCLERLNALDDQAQEAVEASDDDRFQAVLAQMIEIVRSDGEPLDDEELVESAIIIPPPDSTIEQVGAQFNGEGLIPD